MNNPITFCGTYRICASNNKWRSIGELNQKLEQEGCNVEIETGMITEYKETPSIYSRNKVTVASVFSVPDNYDDTVETFCKSKGITFQRVKQKNLLAHSDILSRVGYFNNNHEDNFIVKLNSKKFENLIDENEGNFYRCKSEYKYDYDMDTEFAMKALPKIPVTTLKITPDGDKYSIDFEPDSIEFDHCMYFAMKEAEMKDIPVAVDKETYETGKKLGIFIKD